MTDRGSADPTRRPTLKSVAATAGVSVSTASLVFSGKGPVAAATRERVLAAAADLGYAGPDPLADRLRAARLAVLGARDERRARPPVVEQHARAARGRRLRSAHGGYLP